MGESRTREDVSRIGSPSPEWMRSETDALTRATGP